MMGSSLDLRVAARWGSLLGRGVDRWIFGGWHFSGRKLLPLGLLKWVPYGCKWMMVPLHEKQHVDGCDMAKLGSSFAGIYESYEIENLSTGARSCVHVEDVGHGQHFVNCIVQFIGHLFYN